MASKGKKKPTARQVNPSGSEAKDQSDNSVAVGLELEADQNQDSNQEREEVDFEHERMSNSINLLFTSPIAQDIPKFSATSTDDVKGWLSRINQLKVAFAASDQDAVRFAAIKANCQQSTKFVAQWIETCEEEEAFDWKEFRRAFLTEFEATDDEGLIEQELLNMRRTKHQTLKDYAKLFENAAAKSPSITDDRKCRLFLNTLPDTVKAAGFIIYNASKISKSPLSVKMLSAALASQPEMQVDSPHTRSESNYQSQSVSLNPRFRGEQSAFTRGTLSARTQQADSIPFRSQQDQRFASRDHRSNEFGITCFQCGRRGHYSRECPEPRRYRDGQQSDQRFTTGSGGRGATGTSTNNAVNSINRPKEDVEDFYFSVVLNDKVHSTALVDTGAECCVILSSFIKVMWPQPTIRPTTQQLISADRTRIPTVGEVTLNIQANGTQIPSPVQFVVVNSCTSNLILGQTFIRKYVDYVDGSLSIRKPKTVPVATPAVPDTAVASLGPEAQAQVQIAQSIDELKQIERKTDRVTTDLTVRIAAACQIPALGSSFVPLAVTGMDDIHTQEILFSPSTTAANELGFGSEPFLVRMVNNKLELPVINKRHERLQLMPGLPVGQAEIVQVDEQKTVTRIARLISSAHSDEQQDENTEESHAHVGDRRDSPPSPVVDYLKEEEPIRSSPIPAVDTAASSSGSTQRSVVLPHLEIPIKLDETSTIPLTTAQFNEFEGLIHRNGDIFGKLLDGHGTDLVLHEIPTGSQAPVAVRPYRAPVHLREILSKEIDAMLKAGVITPSYSPWSAPVVLVTKKDGSMRFCVDYRRLNAITERDEYPLPRISDLIDSLSGRSCIFSTLDLLSGFWQIKVHPKDRAKTAFSTEFGHWEFNCMPFGLSNSPASFQRLMDLVLRDLRAFALCYIDDIIVFSDSFNNHLDHLQRVFDALRSAHLIVKPSKCHFLQARIQFLGHVVSAGIVEPDPAKTEAIRYWPTPKDQHSLQVALGLFNYYRKFVPGFSTVADPLNKLLRKGQRWEWTSVHQAAFDSIKKFLTQEPILTLPDFSLRFTVYTDASATGLGAVLTQVRNGVDCVISYASKSLNDAQRNYSTTDRECLAIHWALNLWKPYLLGKKFVVVTDHSALKWLFSPARRDPHRRHARMIVDLQQFDFVITHRAGTQHSNADSLSRLPEFVSQLEESNEVKESDQSLTVAPVTRSRNNKLPAKTARIDPDWLLQNEAAQEARAIRESFEESGLSALDPRAFTELSPAPFLGSHETLEFEATVEDELKESPSAQTASLDPSVTDADRLLSSINLQQSQLEDSHLGPILRFKQNSKSLPQDSRRVNAIIQDAKAYSVNDAGVLVRPPQPNALTAWSSSHSRIVIPTSLRPLLMTYLHDDSIAGHLGAEKTLALISRKYYWDGMHRDVHDYVRSCDSCQQRNTSRHHPGLPIGRPSAATFPFEKIAIDVLGPLPVTSRKNRYCLCIIDIFSRYPIIIPVPNQRTSTIATALTEKVFLEYGFPAELLSDRGTNFMSELFRELLALFKVRKITTLAYRPATNGVVERFNHTLVSMIAHFVASDQKDWDSWISYVLFAFRSSPHSTLGLSPFYFLFGREPRFPIDHVLGAHGPNRAYLKPDDEAYLSDVKDRFEEARAFVSQRIESVARARGVLNSQLRARLTFEIGDKVLRWRPQLRDPKGKSTKFARQWEGPFMVVDKQELNNTYAIVPLNAKRKLKNVAQPYICPASRLKRYYDAQSNSNSIHRNVAVIRVASLFYDDALDWGLLYL